MTWGILEYPGCLSSNVAGWRDLFRWLSAQGVAVREVDWDQAESILIPAAFLPPACPFEEEVALVKRLKALPSTVNFAAACFGVYWLCAAGRDQGRPLAVHESLRALLVERFPLAVLTAEAMVETEKLITASGPLGWLNVTFPWLKHQLGAEIAQEAYQYLFLGQTGSLGGPQLSKQAVVDQFLEPARQWILQHYRDCPSIEYWAQETGWGTRTFQRRWKASFGLSPVQWLTQVRLQKAKEYLRTSLLTWEEVTRRVGFEDASSFRRLFTQQIGQSPQAYRVAGELSPDGN